MKVEQPADSISLAELDQKLLDCADVLRGSIDDGRYKDFILPLVFYGAINDWYEQELAYHAAELTDEDTYDDIDTEAVRKAVLDQTHDSMGGVVIPDEYRWDALVNGIDPHTQQNAAMTANRIDRYLDEFVTANNDRGFSVAGIFNNQFSSIGSFTDDAEGDQLLDDLLDEIDSISFSEIPPDLMGEAYMNMVKRFSEAEGGEYFTPPKISELLVNLLAPYEEDTAKFHDPTAGSAGLLIQVANHLKDHHRAAFTDAEPGDLPDHINEKYDLHGQEKNPTITGIAKMNLLLHGLEGVIQRGDSIGNPQFTRGDSELESYDYVVANFPFSESKWKRDAKARQDVYGDLDWAANGKLPHGNYGDFAFLMHMESHLNETGQLASIIPHGVLFRNGDKKYRQQMIDADIVEAVVGLPEDLFEATGIPSGILILNKDKPASRDGEVMFFNADHEGEFFYDTGSSRTKLTESALDEIPARVDEWADTERVCRVVSTDEIAENEYNMNIALYVDTTEPQEDISVEDTLDSIHDLETQYTELNQQLHQYMHQLDYTTGDNNE